MDVGVVLLLEAEGRWGIEMMFSSDRGYKSPLVDIGMVG
jgi:hypothetical protein